MGGIWVPLLPHGSSLAQGAQQGPPVVVLVGFPGLEVC